MRHISRKIQLNSSYKEAYELIGELLTSNQASLRDCERCYSLLVLIAASNAPIEKPDLYSIAILSFLKTKRPKTFKDFVNGNATYDQILEAMNLKGIKDSKSKYIKSIVVSEMLTIEEYRKLDNPDMNMFFDQFGDPMKYLSNILPFIETIIT